MRVPISSNFSTDGQGIVQYYPSVEVQVQNLRIEATTYSGNLSYLLLPEPIRRHLSRRTRPQIVHPVLHGFHWDHQAFQVGSARMTLLLGDYSGSSGKTTKQVLLSALAGQKLPTNLKVSGRVSYYGRGDVDEESVVPEKESVCYISQRDDVHFAEKTVRETLEFAATCQGVESRYEMLVELARRKRRANEQPDPELDSFLFLEEEEERAIKIVNYFLKVLGLENWADAKVGLENGTCQYDSIPKPQRRLLTLGERLVGPAAALFIDDGLFIDLDNSTTYQVLNWLKDYVHYLGGTAVVSLSCPAPEIYQLFDDIILLSEGHVVYQGPRGSVLEFFEKAGFNCPEKKGVADFLLDVTSRKRQEQYFARRNERYVHVSASDFAAKFQSSHTGSTLCPEIVTSYNNVQSCPAPRTTAKYGLSNKQFIRACMSQEYLLLIRQKNVYALKILLQTIWVAYAWTTIFSEAVINGDGGVVLAALYFIITMVSNGVLELELTVQKLPVFCKQRDLLFYPAWAYVLSAWILEIPITVVQVLIWDLAYYYVGFDGNFVKFLKWNVLLFALSLLASTLTRLIALIAFRSPTGANLIMSFKSITVMILGGFTFSQDTVQVSSKWAHRLSPITYVQTVIAANEFLAGSWKKVLPYNAKTLGEQILKSHGIASGKHLYWVVVGALCGSSVIINILIIRVLSYIKSSVEFQAEFSEEITGQEGSTEEPSETRRRSFPPWEPHGITFSDLRYRVNEHPEMQHEGCYKRQRKILDGISGSFRPGKLTALIDISGKSNIALMNVLAGEITGGHVTGSIGLYALREKPETSSHIARYCGETDIQFQYLTVYDSLLFSAKCLLDPEVDDTAREALIDAVMKCLELTSLKETIVGSPGVNGLSIVQRKRLNIAVQLMANPAILFIPEPTSSLDARSAAVLMGMIKKISDSSRTTVCTIHQPSFDILQIFDELILLKGGEQIYAGPLGHDCLELKAYFKGINGANSTVEGCQLATWMSTRITESSHGIDHAFHFRNSGLHRKSEEPPKKLSTPALYKDMLFTPEYPQSAIKLWKLCIWKQYLSYKQNMKYNGVRLLYSILPAVVVGTAYLHVGSKRETQKDFFTATEAMYVALIAIGKQNAQAVLKVVADERAIFYTPRASRLYSASSYAISQIVIELPWVLSQSLIYGFTIYAMSGFDWTITKCLWFSYFIFFYHLSSTCCGMMILAVVGNTTIASMFTDALYTLWYLCSGYIIPRPRSPARYRWLFWISPVDLCLHGLVGSQFGDLTAKLDTDETGKQLIESKYGYSSDYVGAVAISILTMCVLFAIIFLVAITRSKSPKR